MATVTVYTKAAVDYIKGGNRYYIDDVQFTGADDNTKLANALSSASSQSNIPQVIIGRSATLTAAISAFEGMKLWGFLGELGVTDYELNSGKNLPIKLTISSPNTRAWVDIPEVAGVAKHNVSFGNLPCFAGNSTTTMFSSAGPNLGVYAADWHSISAYGFKCIFGTPDSTTGVIGKFLNTQINITGRWVINPVLNGGIVMYTGGSDSDFWMWGSLNVGGQTTGAGQPLFNFDGQGKSSFCNAYITASQPSDTSSWVAVRFGSTVCSMNLFNVRMEGVNASNPTSNALIDMASSLGTGTTLGSVYMSGCRIAYGMQAPTANGRSDGGMIQKAGGILTMVGCDTEYATGITQTGTGAVPLVYQTAGETYIYGQMRQGSWAAKPGVHAAGGTITHDASVIDI
jgi:hypothetical protein